MDAADKSAQIQRRHTVDSARRRRSGSIDRVDIHHQIGWRCRCCVKLMAGPVCRQSTKTRIMTIVSSWRDASGARG